MGESFIQWVIEDRASGAGRPEWRRSVHKWSSRLVPYEEAKIRLLNATHSCIAWAGTLVGYQYIHEGTYDPVIRKMAYDYVTDDVIPVLLPSPIDLGNYRDVVLDRFGNPAIRDTNQRVAMDGYSKIPGFIAPTFRERLARTQPDRQRSHAAGLVPGVPRIAGTVAKLPHTYQDQAMDPAAAHAVCEAADPICRLCDQKVLWVNFSGDPRLVAAIRAAYDRVLALSPAIDHEYSS